MHTRSLFLLPHIFQINLILPLKFSRSVWDSWESHFFFSENMDLGLRDSHSCWLVSWSCRMTTFLLCGVHRHRENQAKDTDKTKHKRLRAAFLGPNIFLGPDFSPFLKTGYIWCSGSWTVPYLIYKSALFVEPHTCYFLLQELKSDIKYTLRWRCKNQW